MVLFQYPCMKKAGSAIFIAGGDAINKPKRERSRLLKITTWVLTIGKLKNKTKGDQAWLL
jgi:hypothetical protein